MKPYSESCDQNRDPILSVIQPLFADVSDVLEIGSGTGQHAVFFGAKMPHLTWQTSDVPLYHQGIRMWLDEAALPNVKAPLSLDVREAWPRCQLDAVYSANTVHIMGWDAVEACFAGVGNALKADGLFILYGPFNYNGQFTSESNARFDVWLKQRDPVSGVRDFEALDKLAQQADMTLKHDYEMPANNRILVWRKN